LTLTNRLTKHIVPVTLIAILTSATLLRIYKLNSGLWLDEIITYVKYARSPFMTIMTTFDSENQHFLYSILAHLSLLVFGDSNWALRLPAVIFGVASIAALFYFGKLVTEEIEALLAAALLAFSYHHVWFSQNARGYTGMLFWTLLSSYFFIRGMKESKPKFWVLFGLTASLGVYTHLTMAFVLLGQFIIYFATIFNNGRWKNWPNEWLGLFIGFGTAGLLSLLLYAPVLPQVFVTLHSEGQTAIPMWQNPVWTIQQIILGLEIGFAGGVLATGAFILFAAGVISYLRSNLVIVALLILPTLIGGASVVAAGHHLWPRFFFFAIGFAALVAIRGIMAVVEIFTQLPFLSKWNANRVGIVLCIGLVLLSAFSVPFAYGPKQDYGGALSFVKNNWEPGDAVVTVGLASMIYQDYYKTGWYAPTSLNSLDVIREESKRTWLIYTFSPVLAADNPGIMDSVQKDFVVVKQFGGTLAGGVIFVCRADNPVSTSLSSNQ
jgi:mannosyltransferase